MGNPSPVPHPSASAGPIGLNAAANNAGKMSIFFFFLFPPQGRGIYPLHAYVSYLLHMNVMNACSLSFLFNSIIFQSEKRGALKSQVLILMI